jgi:hypothetical protein
VSTPGTSTPEAQPAATPGVETPPVKSPTEVEYEHLKSYFESLVRHTSIALGVISAVALFMFYRSLADVKADASQQIQAVKTSAQNEIAKAKEDVVVAVRAEAQKRVDEEFSSNNIGEMVEAAAKRRVGRAIDKEIQDEVSRTVNHLQEQIEQTSEVGDLGMRMRVGFRDAFDELNRRYRNASDDELRRTEKSILDSITADYEARWKANMKRAGLKAGAMLASTNNGQKPPNSTAEFVKIIRTDDQLDDVCLAFLAFRDYTNQQVRMFDIEAVEKWCHENVAQCQ